RQCPNLNRGLGRGGLEGRWTKPRPTPALPPRLPAVGLGDSIRPHRAYASTFAAPPARTAPHRQRPTSASSCLATAKPPVPTILPAQPAQPRHRRAHSGTAPAATPGLAARF